MQEDNFKKIVIRYIHPGHFEVSIDGKQLEAVQRFSMDLKRGEIFPTYTAEQSLFTRGDFERLKEGDSKIMSAYGKAKKYESAEVRQARQEDIAELIMDIFRSNNIAAGPSLSTLELAKEKVLAAKDELDERYSKQSPLYHGESEPMELRRFRYITEDRTKKDKFSELMASKNLSREDLLLLLTTVAINFDTFPSGSLENLLGI